MKLSIADVDFHHVNRQATICTIMVKGKMYHGKATLSSKDSFSREAGRKIALTKAMAGTKNVLTKVQRRNIWNAYRNLTKTPRW